ncbi:protein DETOXIFICATION 40-like [Panicum hallii]|uniref:protein DETOXIFICATION 40-like n=1 Tax=Panicum hallii TaxID=206008 RepID=UPI000DF4D220|nr:protein DETOXIFICATION 40-like [Panicum hallii]
MCLYMCESGTSWAPATPGPPRSPRGWSPRCRRSCRPQPASSLSCSGTSSATSSPAARPSRAQSPTCAPCSSAPLCSAGSSPCCQVLPLAVACGWQATVAYINIGCYYLIVIPLGVLLGFKFDFGVKGLWGGMIGGTLMQTLILIWITFRTDGNREVEEARKRLDKWGDTRQPLLANKGVIGDVRSGWRVNMLLQVDPILQ